MGIPLGVVFEPMASPLGLRGVYFKTGLVRHACTPHSHILYDKSRGVDGTGSLFINADCDRNRPLSEILAELSANSATLYQAQGTDSKFKILDAYIRPERRITLTFAEVESFFPGLSCMPNRIADATEEYNSHLSR